MVMGWLTWMTLGSTMSALRRERQRLAVEQVQYDGGGGGGGVEQRMRTVILGGKNKVLVVCAKDSNRILGLRVGELEMEESADGNCVSVDLTEESNEQNCPYGDDVELANGFILSSGR
jgi:hypothetical protein